MGTPGNRKVKTTKQESDGANLSIDQELWQVTDAIRGSMFAAIAANLKDVGYGG